MPLYNPPVNLQNEGTAQGSTDTINIVGPGIDGSVSSSTGTITVSTATAVNTGATNAEGNADTLARSNHTHAVTDFSISGQAQGDILYFNGTNWVRLAAGTSGQVLKTNGAGNNPQWISRASSQVVGTTNNPTSTSGTFAVIPQMTITATTNGGKVLVLFMGSFEVQSNDDFNIQIFLDASAVANSMLGLDFSGGSLLGLTPARIDEGPGVAMALLSPAAGSHTFDVRWQVSNGTARAVGTRRQLIIMEIF